MPRYPRYANATCDILDIVYCVMVCRRSNRTSLVVLHTPDISAYMNNGRQDKLCAYLAVQHYDRRLGALPGFETPSIW